VPACVCLAGRRGILREGGSAVDAAVAASAALSVLYPHSDGDPAAIAFWLNLRRAHRTVRYIDGGGRANLARHGRRPSPKRAGEVPYRGVLPGTLTVPGAVASWSMAHAAYGRRPLKRCLESAIGYARDGFPVTARLAHWRELRARSWRKSPEAACDLPQGRITRSPNPDLARALEAIASDGWYGFYDGEGGA